MITALASSATFASASPICLSFSIVSASCLASRAISLPVLAAFSADLAASIAPLAAAPPPAGSPANIAPMPTAKVTTAVPISITALAICSRRHAGTPTSSKSILTREAFSCASDRVRSASSLAATA